MIFNSSEKHISRVHIDFLSKEPIPSFNLFTNPDHVRILADYLYKIYYDPKWLDMYKKEKEWVESHK